jgi:type I restriction enzyme S subunit
VRVRHIALKYLCSRSVAYGANEPASNYVDDGVRFLRTTDITDDGRLTSPDAGVFLPKELVADYLLETGDLLLSRSGTIGRSLLFNHERDGECAYAGYLVRFRPRHDVHPKFLFYFTKTTLFDDQIAESAIQSTIMNFNGQKFASMLVPVPERDAQAAIAAFLDRKTVAIDALIAKKKQLVELLQQKRQALITQAVTKGLDPNVPMKESGLPWLGMVPEHWEVLRLKQLSHRISGRLVYQPAQYFSDEGVPFVMGNNVTERGISLEQTKFIPAEVNARFAHHALRAGDVVMVRVGAPGVTAVVGPEADGLNCGSLMIVRRNSAFDSAWLAAVMNSPVVRAQIDLVQYGAAQEQINITDAVNFLIPTPPTDEQRVIAERVRAVAQQVDGVADKLGEQIARLREYRQALITAAVTGRIDIPLEAA